MLLRNVVRRDTVSPSARLNTTIGSDFFSYFGFRYAKLPSTSVSSHWLFSVPALPHTCTVQPLVMCRVLAWITPFIEGAQTPPWHGLSASELRNVTTWRIVAAAPSRLWAIRKLS